jgi:hypothetical protein
LDICPAPVALTLTRRYDNKEDEKLNTSFGNSITNALSVLGGNQEGYTKSSNDLFIIMILSSNVESKVRVIVYTL